MTQPKPIILIVDDDPELRLLLVRYLNQQGFDVDVLPSATGLERQLQTRRPDLLVLDLMLPGEDGLSICRRLRTHDPRLPIIMLTARAEEIDRIVGLEMGADDYLGKPFNPRELVARIQAVLRRRAERRPAVPQTADGSVCFGPWTFNTAARSLSREGREPHILSGGESELLEVFTRYPHLPLSRDRLLALMHTGEAEAFDRSIDVQVHRLRRLIETDIKHPRYLQTVWGQGYVFVPDAATS